MANSFQEDFDDDGFGDVCDPDADADGILDALGDGDPNTPTPCSGGATTGCDDNCPTIYNPVQEIPDNDAIGDACDDCNAVADPAQIDFDGDTLGDACDADADGDQVTDTFDNCLFLAPSLIFRTLNPLQADFDRDGAGDSCDTDSDSDGVEEEFGDGDPAVATPCAGGAATGATTTAPSASTARRATPTATRSATPATCARRSPASPTPTTTATVWATSATIARHAATSINPTVTVTGSATPATGRWCAPPLPGRRARPSAAPPRTRLRSGAA